MNVATRIPYPHRKYTKVVVVPRTVVVLMSDTSLDSVTSSVLSEKSHRSGKSLSSKKSVRTGRSLNSEKPKKNAVELSLTKTKTADAEVRIVKVPENTVAVEKSTLDNKLQVVESPKQSTLKKVPVLRPVIKKSSRCHKLKSFTHFEYEDFKLVDHC